MGNELAQEREWDYDGALDWELLRLPEHRGVQKLLRDLNFLYCSTDSLYGQEFSQEGFEWLDCHDAAQSIVVYLRRNGNNDPLVVVALNFAAVGRFGYRIGVPEPGVYKEVLNSDARCYGGSGLTNATRGDILAVSVFHMGQTYSLVVDLPPLAGMVFLSCQTHSVVD